MNNTPEDKEAFNARAKASMRVFLRAKSWPEKVDSIARMNAAGKIAREVMRAAQLRRVVRTITPEADEPETRAPA